MKSHSHFLFSFFVIALCHSSMLFSQTLNENYLTSLPPEIQADVLKNIAQETDSNPELYRGPETTVLQLNSQLEQIKFQLMEIESELDSDSSNDSLQEFGSNLFKSFQSSFSPLSLPNMSDDYIIGVGDLFKITMIGQINSDLNDIPVAKDGSLTISKIGKFQVAGYTLREASEIIQVQAREKVVGQEIYLTLSELRDIEVLIIGSVNFPGMYTVSGNSNILSVLDFAGGPSKNGSMRSILHKRNGEIIADHDLYEIFINGNFIGRQDLRAGDVILVQPKGPQVAVSGGVTNPAIYEINDSTSLNQALNFAGGLAASGSTTSIELHRIQEGITTNIDESESDSVMLKNGDSIKVGFFQPSYVAQPSVELSGEVVNPGTYPIAPMETLSSVIQRAGGYKELAYPLGGSIFRESTKKVERSMNEKLYQDMITFLATAANSSGVAGSGSLPLILAEFKKSQPIGRITATFDLDALQANSRLDLKLINGDEIYIPPYSPEIFVLGEVLNGGSKYFKPELTVQEYINLAGGHGRFADTKKVIVISPNGDTFLHSSRFSLFNDSSNGLYPGSIVYVPRQIGKVDGINYAASIAPIFSNLALSIASLNAIQN